MIVLAIDTSGPVAGAALARDGKLLAETNVNLGLTHSETIMPIADRLAEMAGLTAKDVGLFACVTGPGSFTGVRLGVCAVKAMCRATGAPCVALDALEVLAAGAWGFDGLICPILDARRAQVYCAAFRAGADGLPARVLPDQALPLTEYLAALPADGRLYFTGDGVAAHGERIRAELGARALVAPLHLSGLRAGAACFLAERKAAEAIDGRLLVPRYLRAPQAERERAERLAHG